MVLNHSLFDGKKMFLYGYKTNQNHVTRPVKPERQKIIKTAIIHVKIL